MMPAPLPAGDDRHGLPAGVDTRCPCRPCQRAATRMRTAYDSHPLGVPRFRAVRRVQALRAIGYTPDVLAGILEVPVWDVLLLTEQAGPAPTRRLFARLSAAYEVLAARPLDDLAGERRHWPSPLCWDDDDNPIDDAASHPVRDCETDENRHDTVDASVVERVMAGEYLHGTTRAEKEAVVARWLAAGRTFGALESFTGWNVENYTPAKVAARVAAGADSATVDDETKGTAA